MTDVLLWLTQDADVRCAHVLGRAPQQPSQDLVRVGGRLVLVGTDPEGRPIGGCPNIGVAIKPCQRTLRVQQGHSPFVRIVGRPVVRSDLMGLTDGTPPGVVPYRVQRSGQDLVGEAP